MLAPHFSRATEPVKDSVKIDEVVVTGTKTSIQRNQIPLTVSVIQQSEIQENHESAILPLLSQQVPGLFVTQRGIMGFGVANGAAGQISIRGIGGQPTTQVLVLLNGNPQYMGIMGHPLADSYRSANIEKVEVIRGPASVLYGSNAMGGVINIITKEQHNKGEELHAGLSYGSYNTIQAFVNGGLKKDKFNLHAGFNRDQTNGHRPASYFAVNDAYIKTAYALNTNFKLSADFSLTQFNGADPGMDTSNTIEAVLGDTLDILRGMGSLVLDNHFEKADGSLRAFYNFGNHDITSGFLSTDINYGLVAYENLHLLPGNTLTLGLDYKIYGGKAENVKAMNGQGITFVDTTLHEIAGYAVINQVLWDKLTLNAALRGEHHSLYGMVWAPSAGIVYRPNAYQNIRASVSKGYRSPSMRELFINFPMPWMPNPNADLKQEEVLNYEIGAASLLLENKLKLELCIFHIRGTNFIQSVTNDALELQYMNMGDVNNTGVEASLFYSLNEHLSWQSNYAYTHTENPLLQSPEHKLFLGANYRLKKFSGRLNYQFVGGLYNVVGAQENSLSYHLLNLNLAYRFSEKMDSYIKIENLLNQQYEILYGYPMPGTTVLAGVQIHFKQTEKKR